MKSRGKIKPDGHAYPRPQLRREGYSLLNGLWDFSIDESGAATRPRDVTFDRNILVPFAPETPASGVQQPGFFRACWYRRKFTALRLDAGERLILHLGAVDYVASVYVNGHLVVRHEGGYTPFSADITDLLIEQDQQEIVVRAEDDPHDLAKPRGKQDWLSEPHSIWYHRTTGIWQTVWIERVPSIFISDLHWSADVANWAIHLQARIAGRGDADLRLHVRLAHKGRLLADDRYVVAGGQAIRTIGLDDPGIDDAREDLLWHPGRPTLIDAEVTLERADGSVVDSVKSYTAMRSVGVDGKRFMLNGRPYPLRLVLDQGYWRESGLSAPDDEALKRDVELVKAMGFNGVRKHQKIEDPRYLYWADQLGLLVWEEMPSPYAFSDLSVSRVAQQWTQAVRRDLSHPCIVAWMTFNESWGVPDLPGSAAQQSFVEGMVGLTKALDPSRAVIGNDGWEISHGDILGVHDYSADPARLVARYGGSDQELAATIRDVRPAGRVLLLEGFVDRRRPLMLTEFGGIAFSKERGSWGYSRAGNAADFAAQYGELLAGVRSIGNLAGFCYTQFTDTYQEANGLLHMDRTPKFPLAHIATATRGPTTPAEHRLEARWKKRMAVLRDQQQGREK